MVSINDQYIIELFLSLIPNKDTRIGYDEFLGFVFGLAITPDNITLEEWMSWVTNGDDISYNSVEQAEEISRCLQKLYDKFREDFQNEVLELPFDAQNLKGIEYPPLKEWVLGFIDALSLRDECWGLNLVTLSAETREDLFYNMLVVNGVVEPEVVLEVVENIPDDEVQVLFPGISTQEDDVLKKISQLCTVLLKDAIDWLQHHARFLSTADKKQVGLGLRDNVTGRRRNVIFVDFKSRGQGDKKN